MGVYEKIPGSGVWYVRWRDASGADRKKKIGGRAEAVKAYKRLSSAAELERVSPGFMGPPQVARKTLQEAIDLRLATMTVKPGQRKIYSLYAEMWLRVLGASRPLDQVSPGELDLWRKSQ